MSDRLIEHLEELWERDDRGALAALRRGMTEEPQHVIRMHPHVLPYLGPDASRWTTKCCYAVASMFSFHGISATGVSFGRAARRLRRNDSEEYDPVEARFVTLLAAHRDDVLQHMHRIMSLFRVREIGLDWRLLLRDLCYWGHANQKVQQRWARDFWCAEMVPGVDDIETQGATS